MCKPLKIFLVVISIYTLSCSSDDVDPLNITGGWGAISVEGIDELTDCRKNNNIYFNEQGSGLWTHPYGDISGDYSQPCYNSIHDYFSYKINGNDIKIFEYSSDIELNWTIDLNGDLMTIMRPNYYTVVYQKGLNFED